MANSITLYHMTVHGDHVLCFNMAAEVNFALERAMAALAWERFKARVFTTVGDEVWWLAETFPADHAFMGLFAWN